MKFFYHICVGIIASSRQFAHANLCKLVATILSIGLIACAEQTDVESQEEVHSSVVAPFVGDKQVVRRAEATQIVTDLGLVSLTKAEFYADGFEKPIESNDNNLGYNFAEYADVYTTGAILHMGVDLNSVNDCGRAVFAAANGIVAASVNGGSAWGGVVLIKHIIWDSTINGTRSFSTQYGHIAPLDALQAGQFVHRGEKIGYILMKGSDSCDSRAYVGVTSPRLFDVTWSPHIHFEVRSDITKSATAWLTKNQINATQRSTACLTPTDLVSSTAPLVCRQNSLKALGYLNPWEHFGLLSRQPSSSRLDEVIQKGLVAAVDNNLMDRQLTSVITKRQAAIMLARALKLTKTGSLFSGTDEQSAAITYAIESGIISQSSAGATDFELPIKREIYYIMWARAAAAKYGDQYAAIPSCPIDAAIDLTVRSNSCKDAAYLLTKGQISLDRDVNDRLLSPAVWVTRDFAALSLKHMTAGTSGGGSGGTVANLHQNALSNTTLEVIWRYIREPRTGIWYIAHQNGTLLELNDAGPQYPGFINWVAVAGARYTISSNKRAIVFSSVTSVDATNRGLSNTSIPVSWHYVWARNTTNYWYIVNEAGTVLALRAAGPEFSGKIDWEVVPPMTGTRISIDGLNAVFGAP